MQTALARIGRRAVRGAGLLAVLALLALPLAVVWGVGTARTVDYLGPHRSTFAVTYDGQVRIDLGPLGYAQLPWHVGPVGVAVHVGGLGTESGSSNSLLDEQVLDQYAALYSDPESTVRGVVGQLTRSAAVRSVGAEVVLVGLGVLWRLRGTVVNAAALRQTSTRRGLMGYSTVLVLVLGSCFAPPSRDGELSYPVTVTTGTRAAGLTVDNLLLADLLNRGISGARLLAGRQLALVDAYVSTAETNLIRQRDRWPAPREGETMIFGFSDLHCSQAMTRLYTALVRQTRPSMIIDSGDDTINGSAVEQGCISREVGMSRGLTRVTGGPTYAIPFVDSTGNHDSDITNAQLSRQGAVVLDGQVVTVGGARVLGDDDPELQIPFSVNRTQQRPESEAQMGQRLLSVASRRSADERVDVLTVHQPRASYPIVSSPDPPMNLLLWGHMHVEIPPQVIWHADGSWTVALQQGTAGGIGQATLTSISTPISPPRVRADCYFYFRDDATGLITGVQPVRFAVDASVTIEDRILTGDLGALPATTRARLDHHAPVGPSVSATPST